MERDCRLLRFLSTALLTFSLIAASGCRHAVSTNTPNTQKHVDERGVQKFDNYSEKPIKIKLPTQTFLIPRNYFTPTGKDDPDERESGAFGFRMFLPNFEGYTPNNREYYAWQSGKLEQFINIIQASEAVKIQITDGKRVDLPPTAWAEPHAMLAMFINPSDELVREEYGLQCYGRKTPTGAFYHSMCKGIRSNGETIVMFTDGDASGGPYVCRVNYFSEKEQLNILYDYSCNNLHLWKEIDTTVWAKIRAWRAK
jgi:hypothetical protein